MSEVKECRICGSPAVRRFLDLGESPLANSFLKDPKAEDEQYYPLNVLFCENCGLVQLGYLVPPEVMFKNYIYFSSTSETMRRHFAELAEEALREYTKPGELVVEIASNDGVLLKNMLGKGIRVLGVEPATNIAKVANDAGIETLNEFFNSTSAARIADSRGRAAVILANNVFAHIPDLHDCVKGMEMLLAPDGVVIIEVPYLADMYAKTEFDTIYHEHLAYFSIKPLIHLFRSHGMEIFDVKRVPVHGGTIRIYVQKTNGGHGLRQEVSSMVELEKKLGLYRGETHEKFAKDVQRLKGELVGLLTKLKGEGKRLAAYGAPAKGNTLLNYFGIGRELLDYAVDKSQYKVGLFTPGMHLPVRPVDTLMKDRPDYVLILAWNFSEEILRQEAEEYLKSGGHFIIPIPAPKIV